MPVNTTRSSFDTFVVEEFPDARPRGDRREMRLSDGVGTRRWSYVYFAGIPPQGATVISATLRVWLRGPNWAGGPHTVTARRRIAPWKESKLTWNRDSDAFTTATNEATASVTDGVDGEEVEFDVSDMLADVAAGSAWYGIRFHVDSATGVQHKLNTSEAHPPDFRPQLEIEWATAPDAPTDLSPSGGAVSQSQPTLTWVYRDRDGDEQAAFQVEIAAASTIDADGSFTTPDFQTGWVTSSSELWDTSTGVSRDAEVTTTDTSTTVTAATATFEDADVGAAIEGTGIPVGTTIASVTSATEAEMSQAATASGTITATITRTYTGLADGDTRYWVVRVRDVQGRTSPWSDVAEFTRTTKGTFVIDSPLDAGTVEETTPPVVTTLTGRAQEAVAYRLYEQTAAGGWLQVWEEFRFEAEAADGVSHSFAVPEGRITRTDRDYLLYAWSWDTVDREATPGDPIYYFASAQFSFVRSATPSAVTSLTVEPEDPGVTLTFNRGAGVSAPDFFALMIDGVRALDRIEPADFSLGGDPIVYELVYYGATPNLQHTFEVEAVVNDAGVLKHSEGNTTVDHTLEVDGVWLVHDEDGPHLPGELPRRVFLRGTEVPELQIGESSATFYPLGRRDPVRVVDAVRGLEGTVSGTIESTDLGGQGVDNFRWMKHPDQVGRRFRCIYGAENLPVELGQASLAHVDADEQVHAASAEIAQVGEFE